MDDNGKPSRLSVAEPEAPQALAQVAAAVVQVSMAPVYRMLVQHPGSGEALDACKVKLPRPGRRPITR